MGCGCHVMVSWIEGLRLCLRWHVAPQHAACLLAPSRPPTCKRAFRLALRAHVPMLRRQGRAACGNRLSLPGRRDPRPQARLACPKPDQLAPPPARSRAPGRRAARCWPTAWTSAPQAPQRAAAWSQRSSECSLVGLGVAPVGAGHLSSGEGHARAVPGRRCGMPAAFIWPRLGCAHANGPRQWHGPDPSPDLMYVTHSHLPLPAPHRSAERAAAAAAASSEGGQPAEAAKAEAAMMDMGKLNTARIRKVKPAVQRACRTCGLRP